MTVELGYRPDYEYDALAPGEAAAGFLEELRADTDVEEQLLSLSRWGNVGLIGKASYDARQHPERYEGLAEGLADFAADETASSSLLVRIEALECALELGYGDGVIRKSENEVRAAVGQARHTGLNPDWSRSSQYRYLGRELVDAEAIAIRPELVFPPLTDAEIDSKIEWGDYNPVRAFIFLEAIEGRIHAGDVSPEVTRFAPLIRNVHETLAAQNGLDRVPAVDLTEWDTINRCARLLKMRQPYTEVFTDILDGEDAAAKESLVILAEMSGAAENASRVFPARYQEGVKQGLQQVAADALYGVLEHLHNGKLTDVRLPVRGDGEGLQLKLHADDPVELLTALNTAFGHLAYHANDVSARGGPVTYHGRTVKVAESTGFSIFRLAGVRDHDAGIYELTKDSVYIRPVGAATYDAALEYGRPGEGVEASINYSLDVSDADGLSRVGKFRGAGSDTRISIRLDREGVAPEDRGDSSVKRDPTQQRGTLSLDVGSVIGDDSWLSTRVGRFLAWGNMLRAEATGDDTRLNHVTDYFTEEDGDATVFAAEARELADAYGVERLDKDRIAKELMTRVKPSQRLIRA
jgi:hypothetical protein